ncbi:uncharacterized protein [Chelonus insularis]|nr:uncharacterized protein LOC118068202 [Chelonus insularis]XP_034944348.1 uncharacterized protein LOC118070039 [Chelonus insularis]XP_034947869.1 uncharacterized protein LOC118072264 [Chelonus insularis]
MDTEERNMAETEKVDSSTEVDEETQHILGKDPRLKNTNIASIHPEVAARWSSWIPEGLEKEIKENLIAAYPRAENVLLEPQILNEEVAVIMQPAAKKRDEHAVETQKSLGSAMIALGLGISLILKEKVIKDEHRNLLLEYVSDAGMLMAETHHQMAINRRAFILPGLEKSRKDALERCQLDKYLFGEKLAEKIQTTKTIEKAASELKPKQIMKKFPSKSQNHLNWKNPSSKNLGYSRMGQKMYNPQTQRMTSKRDSRYASSHSRTKTTHRSSDRRHK